MLQKGKGRDCVGAQGCAGWVWVTTPAWEAKWSRARVGVRLRPAVWQSIWLAVAGSRGNFRSDSALLMDTTVNWRGTFNMPWWYQAQATAHRLWTTSVHGKGVWIHTPSEYRRRLGWLLASSRPMVRTCSLAKNSGPPQPSFWLLSSCLSAWASEQ